MSIQSAMHYSLFQTETTANTPFQAKMLIGIGPTASGRCQSKSWTCDQAQHSPGHHQHSFHSREKASLTDLIISKTIDILAVTETWLRPHDTAARIADISPPGCTFHHRPRPVGRGSGVGFLISKLFKVDLHTSPDYTSFESICVTFQSRTSLGKCCNQTIHIECYIGGDCNLHLDTPSATTTTLNDILA